MDRGSLLLPLKTVGFLGLSASIYGLYEVDRARRPEGESREALAEWWQRYGETMLRLWNVELVGKGPFAGENRLYPGTDDEGRGRVFVMNHRAALDVFVCFARLEGTFVSRADLARWPVVGMLSRRLGTLYVDRGSAASGAAVVGAMTRALLAGRGVVIFPEGTTHVGDALHEFRGGAFHAAKRAHAEVVPVGIAYDHDDACFGDEPLGEHMRRIAGRKVRVAIATGEPIPTSNDPEALRRAAQARVAELVTEARAAL